MNRQKEDLLDRYLRHDLTDEEYKQVEEWISTDPEIAKELEVSEHILTAFERVHEQQALKEILSPQMRVKVKRPGTPLSLKVLVATLLAASAALLIYIGLQPQYSGQELFNAYYTVATYEEIPHRGGDTMLNAEQEKKTEYALSLYREANYPEASRLFEEIMKQVPLVQLPEDILFYASVSHLETNRKQAAMQMLEHLLEQGDLFKYDAGWYLALIRLQEGRRREAGRLLKPLTTHENIYQKQAVELTEQLNKKKWF